MIIIYRLKEKAGKTNRIDTTASYSDDDHDNLSRPIKSSYVKNESMKRL